MLSKRFLCSLLIVGAAILASCAGNEVNSELASLEKPPRIVDFSTYNEAYPSHAPSDQQESEETGTMENFDVLLTEQGGRKTTLTIVKPYDKAWPRVAKALSQAAFDVTDKDRDAGVFYVSYDPNYKQSGWEKTLNFFSGNSELINDYQLKLTDNNAITEITAELIEDDLDDGSYSDPDKAVETFMLALYKILRTQKP